MMVGVMYIPRVERFPGRDPLQTPTQRWRHNTTGHDLHSRLSSATVNLTLSTFSDNSTMNNLSREELDEIYAFAIDLGRKAGQLLLDGVDKRIDGSGQDSVTEKDSAVDIVTQTDEGSHLICLSFEKLG